MIRKGLWLIGFRGAGKTTLGRALAGQLGHSFLDLDEEWEARQGESILAFVEREGEAAFRCQEEERLRAAEARLGRGEPLVVATGGGCVEWPASREILGASAHPRIFLDPPAQELWKRLSLAQERLKISNLTSFEKMRALLEKRRPFYEKIATFRLENQDISEALAALARLTEQA